MMSVISIMLGWWTNPGELDLVGKGLFFRIDCSDMSVPVSFISTWKCLVLQNILVDQALWLQLIDFIDFILKITDKWKINIKCFIFDIYPLTCLLIESYNSQIWFIGALPKQNFLGIMIMMIWDDKILPLNSNLYICDGEFNIKLWVVIW